MNWLTKFSLVLSACLLTSCTTTEKEVSFQSSGMTHTFSEGEGSVPKGFPLPVYPGSTTTGSVSAEDQRNIEQAKFLMLSSVDSLDKVSTFYQEQLKASGWTVENVQSLPKLVSIAAAKQDLEANIMISADVDKTTISLSVSNDISTKDLKRPASSDVSLPNQLTPPTD